VLPGSAHAERPILRPGHHRHGPGHRLLDPGAGLRRQQGRPRGPADGAGAALALQYSETPAEEHPRIHLDLSVADAAEQAAEADRLVSLGAKRVDWDLYPANPDFVVLADPDDNRFCVVDLSHIW